ncbi:alpha,alpha-trehalase TreA [Rhodopila sp.]|uniref:alpha,alpha-trehalase TreA n=1 Tax=Rhodopila sp. TaxID=2480087 RepID=UPI003D0FF0B9
MRGHVRLIGAFTGFGVWAMLATGIRAQTVGPDYPVPPSIEYGDLYRDVELAAIFADSKTFPDLIPAASPAAILLDYDAAKGTPGFDLASFVNQHFSGPTPPGPAVDPAASGQRLFDYVESLWPVLRQSAMSVPPYSTLLPLPYPYVVPGGRFREVYYWDSYFTMLGLEEDGQHALAADMLKDFAYEIDRYDHVPNGNRSYYLSRSQPPFFALMVELIARRDGDVTYVTYLPELQAEYDYWMRGENEVRRGGAVRHVVRLLDGTVLNRYWDERRAPRDESYREDVQTASQSSRPASEVWRNLRAAAESGWDFSSRWLADGKSLSTVQTLALLPPDLNSLLVHLEETLSQAYRLKGDAGLAAAYAQRAKRRVDAIQRVMWDAEDGVFTDYLWREGKTTRTVTAATVVPLFLMVSPAEQAQRVASTIRTRLLDAGGLATTLIDSGQQWDAPNGWAPLQWLAVIGLRNYGFTKLAKEIATRWVTENIAGYQREAKLVEKYNVVTTGGEEGGGGEYATQIGFGWTNGVLLALGSLYPDLKAAAEAATPNQPVTSVR